MDKLVTGSKEIYGKEKFYPVRVISTEYSNDASEAPLMISSGALSPP